VLSHWNQGVLPGTAIILQFQAGQIAGFAGCNSYSGAYTATPNEDGTYIVTITGIVTTGMSCPVEIMDQESLYLGLLSAVTLAQSQGNALNLVFPAGTGPDGQPYPEGSLIYYQAGTPGP
jgi:hypothetical protein